MDVNEEVIRLKGQMETVLKFGETVQKLDTRLTRLERILYVIGGALLASTPDDIGKLLQMLS